MEPLWPNLCGLTSDKELPPVSNHLDLTFWVVTNRRFHCSPKHSLNLVKLMQIGGYTQSIICISCSPPFSLYPLTNWRRKIWQDILIYHYDINYGFIQGFPVLRKAITSQVKKYNIFFSVFDIVDLLLTHYLPFVLPFSVQGCLSEFFQIVAAKTLKKSVSLNYRQWRSNFS